MLRGTGQKITNEWEVYCVEFSQIMKDRFSLLIYVSDTVFCCCFPFPFLSSSIQQILFFSWSMTSSFKHFFSLLVETHNTWNRYCSAALFLKTGIMIIRRGCKKHKQHFFLYATYCKVGCDYWRVSCCFTKFQCSLP